MKNINKEELKTKSLEKAKAAAGKGKGFAGEFKNFILKGNVVDMAIGVIIGAAFKGIVDALTSDFINPLINSIGGAEVAGVVKLPWVDYANLPEGVDPASLMLNYGDFITTVINFIIMAFILFLILKSFTKLMSVGKKKEEEKKEEPPKPTKEQELLESILVELKKQNKTK